MGPPVVQSGGPTVSGRTGRASPPLSSPVVKTDDLGVAQGINTNQRQGGVIVAEACLESKTPKHPRDGLPVAAVQFDVCGTVVDFTLPLQAGTLLLWSDMSPNSPADFLCALSGPAQIDFQVGQVHGSPLVG